MMEMILIIGCNYIVKGGEIMACKGKGSKSKGGKKGK